MKLVIERSELLRALGHVTSVVERRTTIPILSNVLLKAKAGGLELKATDLEREVILMCADGFSSSFAALSLRELGFRRATDLIGGFSAWKAEGLPVRERPSRDSQSELPGMGLPEPLEVERTEELPLQAAD